MEGRRAGVEERAEKEEEAEDNEMPDLAAAAVGAERVVHQMQGVSGFIELLLAVGLLEEVRAVRRVHEVAAAGLPVFCRSKCRPT